MDCEARVELCQRVDLHESGLSQALAFEISHRAPSVHQPEILTRANDRPIDGLSAFGGSIRWKVERGHR